MTNQRVIIPPKTIEYIAKIMMPAELFDQLDETNRQIVLDAALVHYETIQDMSLDELFEISLQRAREARDAESR